jgi:putative wavS protein
MNIKYLQWDSDFFNKKIGELSPNEAIKVPFNLTQDYDLIIIKKNQDFSCEIDGYEKTFEETKILFEKKLSFDNINEIIIEDTDFQNKPPEDFYDLAYESGKYSRFKLDLNLKNKFQDIYKKWVDNSLNKTFAEKVFYIHSEDTINGFVTLQRDGNTAKIGLIAVNPNFQGKGIGTKLLQAAEYYAIKNNMDKMLIPTQKENILACNFYKKNGYSVKEETIIKHYWRS